MVIFVIGKQIAVPTPVHQNIELLFVIFLWKMQRQDIDDVVAVEAGVLSAFENFGDFAEYEYIQQPFAPKFLAARSVGFHKLQRQRLEHYRSLGGIDKIQYLGCLDY